MTTAGMSPTWMTTAMTKKATTQKASRIQDAGKVVALTGDDTEEVEQLPMVVRHHLLTFPVPKKTCAQRSTPRVVTERHSEPTVINSVARRRPGGAPC